LCGYWVAWQRFVLAELSADAADPPLSLERTIPLHGVNGRIDHMAFDPGRKRLIVAELGNNTVDVIDVVSGTLVHRITGLREPQGIGYAGRPDVILIANAGDGSVRLLKATDFSPAGSIALGDMPTTYGSTRATGTQSSATVAAGLPWSILPRPRKWPTLACQPILRAFRSIHKPAVPM
jgi:hypothetical protein